MASDGVGKIRVKKQKAGTKPYDANRKESFFGRMKSKVKDMLTPSWLSAPAVAYSDADDDCGAGLEEDERGAADAADGADVALSATGKGLSSGKSLETREPTLPVTRPTRALRSAALKAENGAAADGGASSLAEQATAPCSAREKAVGAIDVLPGLEIRKRVRRDFFHLTDGAVQEKRHRTAPGAAADGSGSTSSSLTAVPDKSDSYQHDILLMSKRSLEHHRHDLSPKESESTESELTATASVSDKSAAFVKSSNSTVIGDTQNDNLSQLIKPSFSITTYTSSFTSLNESASFLNASALGESSFYAGKTTFGGASAYRKTALAVPITVQPSNRSALHAKRVNGPGATAVTSATAKRILDTLEKIASPSLPLSRTRDPAAPLISQSATDALLAFRPLPSLSRRRAMPAEKPESQQPVFSSLGLPPVTKLPAVNLAVGKRETVTFDTPATTKASQPPEQPKGLSKVESALGANQSKFENKIDQPQPFSSMSGNDKAGGKIKQSREASRAHYSRPATAPDDYEPMSAAPTLSVAFTLPAESVKGIDLLGVKVPASVPSGITLKSSAAGTASGALPAHYSFASPVTLPAALPAFETKKFIPSFTFRQPADPNESKVDGSVRSSLTSSKEEDRAAKAKVDATAVSLVTKTETAENRQEASVTPAIPAVTSDAVVASGVGLGKASSWADTLLAGASSAGCWECEDCLVSNKPDAGNCCACGSKRRPCGAVSTAAVAVPADVAKPQLSAAAADANSRVDIFKQPQTGWECSACLLRNSAEKKKCVACGAACIATAAEVPQLGSAKSAGNAVIDIFKQAPTGWECGSCLIRNAAECSKCAACGTAKPGLAGTSVPAVFNASPAAADIFKQSVGGWECGTCLIRNASEKSNCVACGSSKPSASGGVLTALAAKSTGESKSTFPENGFGSIFKVATGSWTCAECFVQNKPDVPKCAACGTRKPGSTDSSITGEIKSTAPENGFGSIFKVATGSWTCAECFVQNKPDVTKCVACGTRKPGSTDSSFQVKQPSEGVTTLSATATTVTSDQSKSTTTFKFGGTQSGPSAFSAGFKPLPVVPKFGGEQPSVSTTFMAKAELTSGIKIGGVAAEPQTGLFKSSQAPAALPAVTSGGSSSTVSSPTPATFSFGSRTTDAAAAGVSFKSGAPVDGTHRPFAFGHSVKDEIKTTQQDVPPSATKPVSIFGGFQGSISTASAVAKGEESSITAGKSFSFGNSAGTSSLGMFGSATTSSGAIGVPVSDALSSGSVGFNFGSNKTQFKPADTTSTFKFGSTSSQAQGSADTGVKSSTSIFGAGLQKPAGNPTVAFPAPVFGSSVPAPTPASSAAPATNPLFSFSNAPAPAAGGGFGSLASSSGFNFGQAVSQSAVGTATGSSFVFGNTNPKSDSEHGSRPFVFGSSSSAAVSQSAVGTANGSSFVFGNTNPKSDSEHGSRTFVFGGSSSSSAAHAGSTVPSSGTIFGKVASSQAGEASSTLSDEANPFAPSQGIGKREIRKVPRKFNK